MSEASPAAAPAAPGGDGGAPATPAPAAPAADPGAATPPAAPGTPAPTGQPAAPTEPKLSAEEQAAKAEDDEWDAAEKEIFPGLKSKNKDGKKNEPAKSEEDGKKTPEAQANPEDKKPDAEPKPGDDTRVEDKGTEENGDRPDDSRTTDEAAAARANRAAARDYAQQKEAVASDVRSKMFADVPQTLVDADGDPINSIEDVMRLINPRTQEAFTEEEAGSWLLSAQQQFNKQIGELDKRIERIAEVNLDIQDQADAATAKYGEYLKANEEERQAIWAEYEKTLVKDPESGIIVDAPISLEWFYDQLLGPKVKAQAEATAQAQAAAAATAQADAEAKAEADKKKKTERADRSDIFGGQQPDTRSDDDKEWDEAEKAVFGNQ